MFETLRTLARANWAAADEALEAANAATILAQHLRDARRDLAAAEARIAALMARRKAEARRVTALDDKCAARREEGRRAMAMGEEALAGEIADDIVALEAEREAAARLGRELDGQVDRLRRATETAHRKVRALAADLRTARAAEQIRRVDAAAVCAAPALSDSAIMRAEGVAERLKAREEEAADLAEAMQTLREETSLDDRLRRAGVAEAGPDARRRAEILESFKTEGDAK